MYPEAEIEMRFNIYRVSTIQKTGLVLTANTKHGANSSNYGHTFDDSLMTEVYGDVSYSYSSTFENSDQYLSVDLMKSDVDEGIQGTAVVSQTLGFAMRHVRLFLSQYCATNASQEFLLAVRVGRPLCTYRLDPAMRGDEHGGLGVPARSRVHSHAVFVPGCLPVV